MKKQSTGYILLIFIFHISLLLFIYDFYKILVCTIKEMVLWTS